MTSHEIKLFRNQWHSVWECYTFDAFILPLADLMLPEAEEQTYAHRAMLAVGRIDWETYTTTRKTFLAEAEALLKPYKTTATEMFNLRNRMYVRFMEGRIRFFEWKEKQEKTQIPAIPVGENDFHNTELAAVFAHLPFQPDVSGWLKTINVSWTYDQLHMVTWFSGQLSLGSGNYSRSCPNHSARKTYERLLNPFSLLWIAAALGEDKDLVIRTAEEMKEYATWRARCGVVRRAIPWKRIYELALPLIAAERKAA